MSRSAATSDRAAGARSSSASASGLASGDARGRRADGARGEYVLFELGGGAAAIPMGVVERVLNVDSVSLRSPSDERARTSIPGVPALRVGERLGVDTQVVAWLVLSSPEPARWPNVLLGVGHCIGTRSLADVLPLPVGFHAVHRGLVTGCFALEARDRGAVRTATASDTRLHGVVLDPSVLTRDGAWATASLLGDVRADDSVEASWTGARK